MCKFYGIALEPVFPGRLPATSKRVTITSNLPYASDYCIWKASTGHWKGQYPWPFGRIPIRRSSDVMSRVTD